MMMSAASKKCGGKRTSFIVRVTLRTLFLLLYLQLCEGITEISCSARQCPRPPNTFVKNLVAKEVPATLPCYGNGTRLHFKCSRGFQQRGDFYTTTCDGATGDWEDNGFCEIELLSLIVALLCAYTVVLFVIFAICVLLWKSKRKQAVDIAQEPPIEEPPNDLNGVVGPGVYRQQNLQEPQDEGAPNEGNAVVGVNRPQNQPVAELCKDVAVQTNPLRQVEIEMVDWGHSSDGQPKPLRSNSIQSTDQCTDQGPISWLC